LKRHLSHLSHLGFTGGSNYWPDLRIEFIHISIFCSRLITFSIIYSTIEIAKFYEVNERTLKRWLSLYEDEIGQKIGYFYTPKQVRIIFEKLGMPGVIQFN